MVWKKVEPLNTEMWNGKTDEGDLQIKVGDELVGELVEVRTNIGPNKSNIYHIKKDNNEIVGVWGSTILDSRFSTVEEGEMVKIVYLGKVKSEKTKRSYHNYELYHDKKDILEEDDVINVEDIPL